MYSIYNDDYDTIRRDNKRDYSNKGNNYNKDNDYFDYDKKEVCPTIIKCGDIRSITIPPTPATPVASFTAAVLNINLSCLCDPVVKLEFTINYANVAPGTFNGTLNIQVFRQCDNQATAYPVGQPIIFTPTSPVNGAEVLTFFVCDNDLCNDKCCVYTVVFTNVGATTGTLALNNSRLSAIATCSNNCGCN